MRLHRRELLGSAALLLVDGGGRLSSAMAAMAPGCGFAARPVAPGPWTFFTRGRGAAVEALADRIIPPDPETPGGKDAGCAVFIDRQLAGPYGAGDGLYVSAALHQGHQEPGSRRRRRPAELYRKALAALDAVLQAQRRAAPSPSSATPTRTRSSAASRAASLKLDGVDGQAFFERLLKDVQEGFFADPIYGGNRDMCGWKMIGFPGARYDYRDWVGRHNERYPQPPVSIMGRAGLDAEDLRAQRWRASFPRRTSSIIGLGWTGSILAHELTDEGLDVVAIERGPWRDAATDFPRPTCRTSCATASATSCSCGPSRRPSPSATRWTRQALPIRSWGAFMPPNGVGGGGVHWNAETWRFLPSDFVLQDPSDAALRRELPARRHDHPGLGRHLRRARAALRPFRISLRHLGHGGQSQGARSRTAAIRSKGRARGPIPTPPQEQPFSHTLFAKAARELGYKPFPQPSGNHVAGLRQSARRAARALHLLRLLRMVRLRQLLQGQPADDDPAGAAAQVEFHCARRIAR